MKDRTTSQQQPPHQAELFPPEALAATAKPPHRWLPYADQLRPPRRGTRPPPRPQEVKDDG